jgi:phosphatidate cytidylyltransferase
MLLPRILTALVLLALILPTLFFGPPWTWGLLTLAFCAIGALEWCRLINIHPVFAAAVVVFGALWLGSRQNGMNPQLDWTALAFTTSAAAFWVIAAPSRLARAMRPARGANRLGGPLILLVCGAAWLASYELRAQGVGAILSVAAVVWIADIAAYFGGRAWGRRKLAPNISPGKTWAGAFCAVGAVTASGLIVTATQIEPVARSLGLEGHVPTVSLPTQLVEGVGLIGFISILVLLTIMAIVGDLFESLLKREAGVKDSGRLLPGHGGVLDRIDALLPVLPLGYLAWRLLAMPMP